MAASNAPNHDFAPAWLKIPDENNSRPNGSKIAHTPDRSRQQRRDENYHNRYGGEYPRGLNRQNSFEVYDSSKRYSPSHGPKYRHHSVEDEYYYSYGSYGYAYPYTYSDPYMQFASQPSIPRRDLKYAPPPQPRFGQVNGSYQGFGYPHFYDFFPHGEGFNTYGNGGLNGSKRSHYARDGRGESKDSDRSSHEGDDKDKIFNDDFPSLNGTDDDGDAKASKSTNSSGVWDNPPRSKFEDANETKNIASGLYKVIPSKTISSPVSSNRRGGRDGTRVNGSLRDMSPLSSTKPIREGSVSSTSQPMEILSTRLARPKPADMKKSQFLKALRKEADNELCTPNGDLDYNQESNNNVKNDQGNKENSDMDSVMNGVNDLHLDHDLEHGANGTKILSSSMEKEIMFMRSLGWNPNETESEITEDEKQEFLRISQQQQQRNGRIRTLPKTWSPQHLAPAQSNTSAGSMNDSFSSSDTDSDEAA